MTAPRPISHIVLAAFAAAICGGAVEASGVAGRAIPCDLKLKVGRRWERPPGQLHLDLVLVDEQTRGRNAVCRVSGFPDVELTGPADPTFGPTYALPRQAGRSRSVALRAGGSAHAVLTWLPSSGPGKRWTPRFIRVVVRTDRGPRRTPAVPWRYGSVLRQDAATHPGTYVGPLRPGAG